MSYDFKIERTTAPKAKPESEAKLGFGKIFTDHMFLMNYDDGQGWHDGRVVPYGPIALDPSAMVFHRNFLKVLKHTELLTVASNFSVLRKISKE